jgi:thiol-disulfide isomerase/thioredoxin
MRRILKNSESGDARADATMFIMLLFFGSLAYVAITTNPVYVGVKEGPPALTGSVYNGGAWVDYSLNSTYDSSWVEGSSDGDWTIVEFMDINCGYCKKSAGTIAENAELIDNSPATGRANVNFIAVAISLPLGGEDYTRENVINFRNTYGHEFYYLDGMADDTQKDTWQIRATPTYFIVKPNGVIAWAGPEHSDEDVWQAYGRLVPVIEGA